MACDGYAVYRLCQLGKSPQSRRARQRAVHDDDPKLDREPALPFRLLRRFEWFHPRVALDEWTCLLVRVGISECSPVDAPLSALAFLWPHLPTIASANAGAGRF